MVGNLGRDDVSLKQQQIRVEWTELHARGNAAIWFL
jgi:hypothetical protein